MSEDLVIGLLAIAYLLAAIGFCFLADLTQWLVQAPRFVYMKIFHFREPLMILSLTAFLLALIANYWVGVLGWQGVTLNLVVFIPFFIGAFQLVNVMFPRQQSGAVFEPTTKVDPYIRRDDEVMVVELNGDARAFPNKWMRQPHIVGDTIGGEEIVMTYCSLSHLGLAYSPYINGKKAELKTFTQLQNNLVMFDSNTDEPIQQIYGKTEHGGQGMQEYPVQVMTYGAFKMLYPDGKVFYNPARKVKDTLVRMMLRTVINWQHELDVPVFPTIDLDDPGLKQLHLKEKVWCVRIADEKVAYTLDYFEKNNWIINTQVGGQDIVLVYYPGYRTVSGFERSINGRTLTITELDNIDVNGNTPHGKLKRIPVASEVFWMIWYTFYPETRLNA
ncbi:MAG: DUF3179 domain-containing (seleno)protein [Gammaproteobacteria bacterium]